MTTKEQQLTDEILKCNNCNVTKDLLSEYPFGNKDKLTFDNLCMHHKIIIIKQEARKELIKEFEKMFIKFVEDSDVDGRKINFSFYDSDYYDFIKQLSQLGDK